MSTPTDPNNQNIKRQKRGFPIKFLVPLIYAPILPLILANTIWFMFLRIQLRRNPVLRDRMFTAVLAGAFIHGAYLVSDLYDAESK